MKTQAILTQAEIRTYSTANFRDKYMMPGEKLNEMLKADFGKFFISRVEEMLQIIRLPVPPSRSLIFNLIYLTDGEAVMTIGSKTYTIYKNQCLVVPAGQVFSFSSLDKNKGFICGFHIDFFISRFVATELLESFEFLNVWGNPSIDLGLEISANVHFILQRLFKDYTNSGHTNIDILQAYLFALLCEINSVYKPLSESKQVKSVKLTNQFKELLFKHIRTKHLVTDYTTLLHITPNHLNRVVKAITGKSPTKLIDEALLLEAKVLLYQTNYSISQVAEEIGIYDQSYFSRLFKKYEGITPLAFRKMVETS